MTALIYQDCDARPRHAFDTDRKRPGVNQTYTSRGGEYTLVDSRECPSCKQERAETARRMREAERQAAERSG